MKKKTYKLFFRLLFVLLAFIVSEYFFIVLCNHIYGITMHGSDVKGITTDIFSKWPSNILLLKFIMVVGSTIIGCTFISITCALIYDYVNKKWKAKLTKSYDNLNF